MPSREDNLAAGATYDAALFMQRMVDAQVERAVKMEAQLERTPNTHPPSSSSDHLGQSQQEYHPCQVNYIHTMATMQTHEA